MTIFRKKRKKKEEKLSNLFVEDSIIVVLNQTKRIIGQCNLWVFFTGRWHGLVVSAWPLEPSSLDLYSGVTTNILCELGEVT